MGFFAVVTNNSVHIKQLFVEWGSTVLHFSIQWGLYYNCLHDKYFIKKKVLVMY